MSNNERRAARAAAIGALNGLANARSVAPVGSRSGHQVVIELYAQLCQVVAGDEVEELSHARSQWCTNGGGDLDESLLPVAASQPADEARLEEGADGAEPLPFHRSLTVAAKKSFRLCSRAFMLTFNSLAFLVSDELWTAFCDWVKAKCVQFHAKYFSATMERSAHSGDDRIHLHCYLSWHGTAGVDHRTTDAWVFQGVRPRVDMNSEHRGPWHWMRATQHGHFYVQVDKEGTIFSSTNYPAWGGVWVPEAMWVTSLWKQHKLCHEAYLALSVKLRSGHDRRRADVVAVMQAESAQSFLADQTAARKLIAAASKPFKPLPDKIQQWRLQYESPQERYQMLILHGPSRTGKSRLARALFGDADTLVVDVQHADHPDLRSYKRSTRKALLLDEMSSPAFVVKNKKLLQAHVDGAILGQSATQLYTYWVFLWQIPIMLTTNSWDYSEYCPADVNWLQTNCVEVYVGTPVWQSAGHQPPPATPAHSTSSDAEVRRIWSPGNRCRGRSLAQSFETVVTSPDKKRAANG
jgi:hypothetical protein